MYEAYTDLISLPAVAGFSFLHNFSLPLFAPIFIPIHIHSVPLVP